MMNVRSPIPWDTKHGDTQYFQFTVDMCFVLDFFISFMYDLKNYCIVYLYTQTSQIVCFCCDRKILWGIRSGDFKFLRIFFLIQ